MRKRIALLGITHESNTFIDAPTTVAQFEQGHWFMGERIRQEYAAAHHEIGGILDVFDACNDAELVPVFYAEATPGGTITADTYAYLLDQMMAALTAIGPVDGCMVVPHGAGVSEAQFDMDGHWLSVLREKVGPDVPIIGTLDPHANGSPAMADATDALIAYSTNPHVDQRETGRKAARLMLRTLRGEVSPRQQLMMLPMAISIEQQHTAQEPCKSLYACMEKLSQHPDVLSISLLLGFPYADVVEMGASFLVITDGNAELAMATGQQLTDYMLERKTDFNGPKRRFEELAPTLADALKPVLLLDMGDNIGGGSPGNSTVLLEELETYTSLRSFIYLHDPAAVREAQSHPGQTPFPLTMGKHPVTGSGYVATIVVEQVFDGKFSETTPRHGGQMHYDMGPTVVVRTERGTTVMLSTYRIPPFSLRQLTAFGLDPSSFDVLVAKGVNAPLAAYGPVCPTVMQVDTPGVTQADMTAFAFKNRRRPLFPFDSF